MSLFILVCVLSINFYQNHLDYVSRSFAFCIARLPEPLRTRVSLAYLLCRVLDTAEDALWADHSAKQQSFKLFENFLHTPPDSLQVQNWIQLVGQNEIKDTEKKLLSDFALLLADFHSLPLLTQDKLRRSITCMSQGMSYFSDLYKGELKLKDLKEVNQYCFFVAGTVGELLTDLISENIGATKLSKETYLRSHHFGLFLQKINILKDQNEDEKNNKFFIHNKEEFIMSLKTNAHHALHYILSIPVQQKEFRLFCSWSLFIGLSSLGWIQNSWLSKLAAKLPRSLTEQLLGRVESIINDNMALQKLFTELLPNANTPHHQLKPIPLNLNQNIINTRYYGVLDNSDLAGLILA